MENLIRNHCIFTYLTFSPLCSVWLLNFFFIFVISYFVPQTSFNEMLNAQKQQQICSYIIAGGDRWINSLSVWCIRRDSSVTLQYFRTLFLKGPADITGGSRGRPGAGSSHAGQGERKNKEWNKLCGFTVVINQFHQPKQRQQAILWHFQKNMWAAPVLNTAVPESSGRLLGCCYVITKVFEIIF